MQNYTFFGKWQQITLKNVTQDFDFVWAKGGLLSKAHYTYSAKGGLLSKAHYTYSNNLLVINRNMPHKSLFQRDLSFAQQSFTHRDFSIMLFASSMATVSNDAR